LRKWECFSGKGNFRIQLQHLQATCFTLRVEHENRNREPETSGSNRKWSLNQRYERCDVDMKFLIYDHKHDSLKKNNNTLWPKLSDEHSGTLSMCFIS
jgi:hypothetical protein